MFRVIVILEHTLTLQSQLSCRWFILFLRIAKYFPLSMIPSYLASFAGPEIAKYPQRRILPPTYLIIGGICFGLSASFSFPPCITGSCEQIIRVYFHLIIKQGSRIYYHVSNSSLAWANQHFRCLDLSKWISPRLPARSHAQWNNLVTLLIDKFTGDVFTSFTMSFVDKRGFFETPNNHPVHSFRNSPFSASP